LSLESLVKQLLAPLVDELPSVSLEVYQLLFETALAVAKARGYVAGTTQVSFFCPAEVIAYVLGIHRATLYRHLPALIERGLIAYRAHRTTHNGHTVADGTVWSIKLTPLRGKKARVSYEDLKHKYRDLSADIEIGRTAYNLVRQSSIEEDTKREINLILEWALPRSTNKPPLPLTVARDAEVGVECVLDVPYAPKKDRGVMVDKAAKVIAGFLGDDSLNFYRWLLWQALRVRDGGVDYFVQLHLMITRAGVDYQEGFARSAGALLVSRLKESGLWRELREVPPYSVGTRPK